MTKQSRLSSYLPEQRIYLRSETTTRYFRVSPRAQLILGVSAAIFLCWSVLLSITFVIDRLTNSSDMSRAEVLQSAYETRIEEISAERDQRADEAARAQERFYVALEQISIQQSELLRAQEEKLELSAGLDIMQQKLQDAMAERDLAQSRAARIRDEYAQASGDLSQKITRIEEIETTLDLVAGQLSDVAQDHSAALSSAELLSIEMREMQFDAALAESRYQTILARIEEAADAALSPLESALNRSGINTESLLREIRANYSGIGGPVTPLEPFSDADHAADHADEEATARANALLADLERIGVMQVAARKLPLGHPVAGSYRYTSGFGYRRDPTGLGRRMHNGRDMAGSRGTPIVSTGDGVVVFAGRQSGYGNVIKIRHAQGFETYYAHLNRIRVKTGQTVSRGERIGDMGNTGKSTGVHLHYEIRIGGKPVNPAIYMRAASDVF